MNVFEKLEKNNIPYSVWCMFNKPKLKSIKHIDYEWFIMTKITDRIKGSRVCLNSDRFSEYELDKEELRYFKDNIDKYIKVLHTEDGKIFELKTNSFKLYVKK